MSYGVPGALERVPTSAPFTAAIALAGAVTAQLPKAFALLVAALPLMYSTKPSLPAPVPKLASSRSAVLVWMKVMSDVKYW